MKDETKGAKTTVRATTTNTNGTIKVASYENLQSDIRKIDRPPIETFANEFKDRQYNVRLECGQGELTSVCPKTGLPDFGTLFVNYRPMQKCLELKSFKEYLLVYREVGIFHEFLTNLIAEDIVKAIKPAYLGVEISMNPRGNIATYVFTERVFDHGTGKYESNSGSGVTDRRR